jgi:uncharacterized protein
MPITTSDFKPNFYLQNGHIQTLLAKFWPRTLPLKTRIERLELNDGDFVDCHWVGVDKGPIVIILHGLEGSIESHYIQGMLYALQEQGLRGVLMHFRGCSGTDNRLPRAYHSGDTQDFGALITHLLKNYPNEKLLAIGYSLGGNVLLKYLGEQGIHSKISASVAVSVPYKLEECVLKINQGMNKLYQHRFLSTLKNKILAKMVDHPLDDLQQDFEKIKTLYAFDDKITAKLHGFQDAQDYYQKSSCYPYLKNITTPTLLIHAKDDPLLPPSVIPTLDALSNNVTLEVSTHGGHVGFIQLNKLFKINYWLEQHILDYLNARINNHFK